MQTFYDQLFETEGGEESPQDWKFELTQVELEELSVVEKATRAWEDWG